MRDDLEVALVAGRPESPRPGPTHAEIPRWVVVSAAIIATSPLWLAVIVWSFREWVPVGDFAVIDLRVRDVFTGNTPLLGPYSRYGWNHPGGFEFWVSALFGLPFGRPAWATLVAHALLQLVPLVIVIRWAARRSRAMALGVCLFIGVCYGATGSWMAIEPWNPHVAYAYWIGFLTILTLVVLREPRMIGPLVLFASIVVQLHIGYAPLVVVPLALAAWWTWRATEPADRSALRRHLTKWVVASAALWIPVAINDLIHRPGNAQRVLSFFRHSDGRSLGLRTAGGILGEGFALPPQWAGRDSRLAELSLGIAPRSAWWMVIGVVLLLAGWWCSRALGPAALRLVLLDVILVGTGLVALSRVTDVPSQYLYYWRIPVAVFVCFTVAAITWRWASSRSWGPSSTTWTRLGPAVALAVLLVRVGPVSWDVVTSPPTVTDWREIETTTADALDAVEADGLPTDPILLRAAGTTLLGYAGGVFDGLDRAGVDVRVGPGGGFQFGYDRATLEGVNEVWYAVEGGPWLAELAAMPNARVVVSSSPLSEDDEARVRELQLKMMPALRAAGLEAKIPVLDSALAPFAFADVPGIDAAELSELGEINQRIENDSCRCALIALPLSEDPELQPIV